MKASLYIPRPATVRADGGGVPVEVDGQSIELVRESWLVEDRWWTSAPLRRRYWEAVTESGRNLVVFRDLAASGHAGGSRGADTSGSPGAAGSWFLQGS